jgi:hypothetical protein
MQGQKWSAGIVAKDVSTTFNAWSFSFTEKEKEVLYLTRNEIPVKSTEFTAPRLQIGGAYNFIFGKNFCLLAEADLDLTFDGKRSTVFSSDVVNIDPHLWVRGSY